MSRRSNGRIRLSIRNIILILSVIATVECGDAKPKLISELPRRIIGSKSISYG